MSRLLLGALGLALLGAPPVTQAQSRFEFELRPGLALPTQDLIDAALGTGFGFEGTIGYRFMPHLALYTGWDWHRFSTETSFAGPDRDFEETGYVFGLRFQHPFGGETGRVAYQLRAGGTYNHVEVEDAAGELVLDTGHGLGFEVGAGVAFSMGNWQLVPGVRYRSLKRDFEIGNTTTSGTLAYLGIELGFSRRF